MKQNHAKVILLYVNQKIILCFWTSILMDLEKFTFSRICKILFLCLFCKGSHLEIHENIPSTNNNVTSVIQCSASTSNINQNWKRLLSDTFISVVSRTLLSLKCNVGPSGRWVMTNPSHTGLRKRYKLLLH